MHAFLIISIVYISDYSYKLYMDVYIHLSMLTPRGGGSCKGWGFDIFTEKNVKCHSLGTKVLGKIPHPRDEIVFLKYLVSGALPGCIPCKLYAGDTPTLTIDSIVICQTPRRRSPNFCARNAPWVHSIRQVIGK